MCESMKQRYGLVRRPWGVFYLKDKITGSQTSLKTDDKHEAQRLLQARNESEIQPAMSTEMTKMLARVPQPIFPTGSMSTNKTMIRLGCLSTSRC